MKPAGVAIALLPLLLLPATIAHPGWTEDQCQPSTCIRIDSDPHIFILHGGHTFYRGVWMDTNGIHGLQGVGAMDGTPPDQRLIRLP